MTSTPDFTALKTSIDALRGHGVVPKIALPLRSDRDATLEKLRQAVLDQVPAYSDSGNPDIAPELEAHLGAHIEQVVSLLSGVGSADTSFVREHAQHRAEQRFPLEALLQTYRCAHNVLSEWLRDAALASAYDNAHVRRVVAAIAEFGVQYSDIVSTTATSSYVNQTRVLAESESDRRSELLTLLLQGYDESDSRAAQLLRRAGYLEQRQTYCVVVARSVDPREMQNSARAQRMADALSDALSSAPLRTLVAVRNNLVIVIVSATRRLSGWTAPQSLLADRLIPYLRKVGPAALIGMSNDVPSTSHVPRAAIEATLALEFASFAKRVMPYSAISLRQLLLSHAKEKMQAALPGWAHEFVAADRRGRLRETLRAYANADMNVLQAAKMLAVHPNTIYSRVQRIDEITGLNALTYHGLTELLLAADCTDDCTGQES